MYISRIFGLRKPFDKEAFITCTETVGCLRIQNRVILFHLVRRIDIKVENGLYVHVESETSRGIHHASEKLMRRSRQQGLARMQIAIVHIEA